MQRAGRRRQRGMMVAVGGGPGLGVERGQDLVFAKETGKRCYAGQRQGAHQERGGRDRHHSSQAAKATHVDHASHTVHHRAGTEEQQRFKAGVREQVEDRGSEAEHGARSQACEHVAQLADGRIGKHAFEIVLHGADQRGHQCRRGADDRYHDEGAGTRCKQRRRSHDQVDARRHHRRRVDQGAGGRRAFHGIRQPDMQRQLGTLAAGRQQQEQADRCADRAAREASGSRKHIPSRIDQPGLPEDARHDHSLRRDRVVEVECAVAHPEQKHGDGQAEVADPVDEEGLLGGAGRLRLGEPDSDQQIAAGPHRFPEDVHKQEVAGRHQHRHRKNKHRHQSEEPRVAGIVVHVADGIDGHEQAHAGDDDEHRGGERIQTQRHRNCEAEGLRGRLRIPRSQTGIRGRAVRRRRVGLVERRPVPERCDHLDRSDRLGVGAVRRVYIPCGDDKQDDRHHGRRRDAGDRGQVRPRAKPAAQKHGEHRADQGQQRHEHQEHRGREFLHGV